MGRRKGFFTKDNSVTYSLIDTSAPAGEQPQRLWIEKSRGVGVGRPDPAFEAEGPHESIKEGRWPPGHPLALLDEVQVSELSAEQRREIVNLGLPDDGYDYLQHLRDPRDVRLRVQDDAATSSVPEGMEQAIRLGSRQISLTSLKAAAVAPQALLYSFPP